MRFPSLDAWLDWQQSLHPRAIDLTLERVRGVAARLGLDRPPCPVATIGGTNGKGSVATTVDSLLRAAGYDVLLYTSPHLQRYHERIRLNGQQATDAQLLESFARIDDARGDVTLTFFEWGTLAALDLAVRQQVDALVLEVGLGGRLDATNLVDADVACVVSIGLDHCEWLGNTREAIGAEKAGIFRAGRPAIFGSRQMPASVALQAAAIGARLQRLGVDFDFVERPDGWDFVGVGSTRRNLPLPVLAGTSQLGNAATALAVVAALEPRLLVPDDAAHRGLAGVRLAGRFQVVPGAVEWILDVAHNPAAAAVLAANLRARPCAGATHVVCGVLDDKDAAGIARELGDVTATWWLAPLEGPRALAALELAARVAPVLGDRLRTCESLPAALSAARDAAVPGDRIVVLGSFHAVGPAIGWLGLPGA